jgi:hypothetical protein
VATQTLRDFTARLTQAFGTECAVVLYGSAAARADADQGTDQNLLVVVRALRGDALRAAAPAIKAWQESGHTPPLILTEAEWRSSRDVFAMEHADIGAQHRVLAGTLPSVGAPTPHELRHQLEYEALGALIHLRRGILATAGDPVRALELLTMSKGTVMALLRGVLRVHGEPVPADGGAVVRAAALRAGFAPEAFLEVLAHARGDRSIPPARAAEVLDAVHVALKLVVAHVDALVHPDAPAVD